MRRILKGKVQSVKSAVTITVLALVLVASGNSAQAAAGVNVETHTPDEIRTYIKNNGGDINEAPVYATQPVTTGPNYSAGSLTDATQQNAIKVLNGVRYIAGVPYNVAADSTYVSQVQAGVLINYVNKKLTHTPEQPSDMSDELYNLGYKGTSSSNIEGGSGTSARALGKSIVYGWMGDGDSSNIDRVGHRRWCLNPSMAKTGFGSVWGQNGCYSAMYSFDTSNSTNITTVPWPAQNMPTEYFTSNSPWSVSRSTAFAAGTTVKLTRLEDNKVWNFSTTGETTEGYYSISNAGYGMTGCVIFRPSGVTGYYDGDAYRVQVTENGNVVIDYTVTFFDLENTTADATVKLSSSSGKISVTTDSYYHSGPTITLSDSSISFSKLSIVSSDESVVKAIVDTESTGSGWLFLKGIKDGVATITVSLSKTAYATYTVTVGNGDGHTHSYDAGVVTKAAACTAAGVKTYTCSICKATKTESVPATGHTAGSWVTTNNATCTTAGEEKQSCSVCSAVLATRAVPATGHTESDWIIDQAATITQEGSRHKECTVCKTRLENATIDKISGGSEEAHTHTPGAWETTTVPTCTTVGEETQYCTECHNVYATRVLPVTGHIESDWIIDIAADYGKTGSKHKECTVCHVTLEKQIIPQLTAGSNDDKGNGDSDGDGDLDDEKNSCRHAGGIATCETKAKCTICGEEYGDLLPHELTDWIIDEKPAATKKGSRHKECRLCGKTMVTEDIPVLPVSAGDTVSVKGMNYIITNESGVTAAVQYAGIDTEEYNEDELTTITIPGTIVINGRIYKVTSIRKNAFKNNKCLRKVVIGGNVTVIGDNAFYGCRKLKQITISPKITKIGRNAFANCKSLTKISIPASVTSIGTKAFYNCTKLRTIAVKTKKLTNKSVGKSAFKGIAKKAKITVPKSKLKAYKKLLKKKGVSSKAVIKK